MYERCLKTELFGFGSVWLGLREPISISTSTSISVKEISIFGAVCGREPYTWFLGRETCELKFLPIPNFSAPADGESH